MRLYIKRREEKKLEKSLRGWVLVYGRRKTGKTTLVINTLKDKIESYFLIADQSSAVTLDDKFVGVNEALEETKRVLKKGGIAVIDEFQRLPESYYSVISNWSRSGGTLLALGSSYGIVNKVFDRNSPLLGYFLPFEVNIISYEDVLYQVSDPVLSVIYRDPWIIRFENSYGEILDKIKELSLVAKGLIGEVFKEEERYLTDIYYRILLLLGEGIWKTSEISGIVQPQGGEATISSMVNKLYKMGLVRKVPLISRGYHYGIRSPVLSLILYAESKYLVSEREANVRELPIGREVQFSVGEMLANYFGSVQYYSEKEDIDVILVKKRKPIWAFEVKMGEFSRSEAKEAVKRMAKVAEKAGLISLKERPEDYGDLSLGPEDLLKIAEELVKKEMD
ncbi:ATP-binding protein [Metallosphaera tengchongensis]|uniref:ATP-binding protein n=1 Tax=Metallosphaera tengchongensis TaxID=1532350 RepID=A0A6N0NY54_9CREN|nr:AAA family ATPase [Metallosphaera tengchongensis]QKR00793.1 ATP-binding protein [Metallosphaera tengchongensis]